MTYGEALEIVHSLATGNQIDANDIDFGDDGLQSQQVWQADALNTLQNLVANHADVIDARFAAPETPDDATTPADRDSDPNEPLNAIKICLDLGRNAILDDADPELADEIERQERAVALVETFVSRHGDDFAAQLTGLRLG